MLWKLSLRSNYFNGSIPASFSKLTFLRSGFLQYNSLSSGLPQEIGNLTNLEVLNLTQNHLSGEISNDLPPQLQYLDLSSNSFSGDIPVSIANLSQLQLVNISYNNFSSQIRPFFGELQSLEYLWFDHNLLKAGPTLETESKGMERPLKTAEMKETTPLRDSAMGGSSWMNSGLG
ncbi:hypothetical protein CDL15_Pgr022978 [Punica granatum]|nr:hypothetical protein CDL15_Pgr022978 [Punica granatum]